MAVLGVLVVMGGCDKAAGPGSGAPSQGGETEPPAHKGADATNGTPHGSVTAPDGPGPIVVDRIHVAVAESGSGISATVKRVDPTGGSDAFFAKTDVRGLASPGRACKSGDQFRVEPDVQAYLAAEPEPCAASLEFQVYAAKAVAEMLIAANNAYQAGRFTEAQDKFAVAAQRLKYARPAEAQAAGLKAHAAAGLALGVKNPITVSGGVEKIGPETIERLKRFQRAAKVPPSGELDAPTRDALKRLTVEQARKTIGVAVPAPP
jgi:hypothetical protein